MAQATVSSSPTCDAKNVLALAEADFRLAKFKKAHRQCEQFVLSEAFSSLPDSKKHQVMKDLIRYGHHSGRAVLVLNMLKEKLKELPDYPLYVCEWVCVELGDADIRHLRIASHKMVTDAREALEDILVEGKGRTDKKSRLVREMTLPVLLEKVHLANAQDIRAAEASLAQYGPLISDNVLENLRNQVAHIKEEKGKSKNSSSISRAVDLSKQLPKGMKSTVRAAAGEVKKGPAPEPLLKTISRYISNPPPYLATILEQSKTILLMCAGALIFNFVSSRFSSNQQPPPSTTVSDEF